MKIYHKTKSYLYYYHYYSYQNKLLFKLYQYYYSFLYFHQVAKNIKEKYGYMCKDGMLEEFAKFDKKTDLS